MPVFTQVQKTVRILIYLLNMSKDAMAYLQIFTSDIAHDLHFEISEVSNNHKQSIDDTFTSSSVLSVFNIIDTFIRVFLFLCFLFFYTL